MKRIGSIVAGAAVFCAASSVALGATEGVLKDRQDLMKALGGSMKATTAMMRGQAPYDADQVREMGTKIASHGGEAMTKLFPSGSLDGDSAALPAIWENWDRFSALAEQLNTYGLGLAAAAGNARGAAPAPGGASPSPSELAAMSPDAVFALIGQTCAGCHQDFRKKKQ